MGEGWTNWSPPVFVVVLKVAIAGVHQFHQHSFRPRVSAKWLSELRRLLTSVLDELCVSLFPRWVSTLSMDGIVNPRRLRVCLCVSLYIQINTRYVSLPVCGCRIAFFRAAHQWYSFYSIRILSRYPRHVWKPVFMTSYVLVRYAQLCSQRHDLPLSKWVWNIGFCAVWLRVAFVQAIARSESFCHISNSAFVIMSRVLRSPPTTNASSLKHQTRIITPWQDSIRLSPLSSRSV